MFKENHRKVKFMDLLENGPFSFYILVEQRKVKLWFSRKGAFPNFGKVKKTKVVNF